MHGALRPALRGHQLLPRRVRGSPRPAALALGELTGPQSEGEVLKVQGALVHALRDPQPRVRAMAASALGRAKSAEALEPLIGALQDEDPLVRRTATVVLEGFDDPRAVEALAP